MNPFLPIEPILLKVKFHRALVKLYLKVALEANNGVAISFFLINHVDAGLLSEFVSSPNYLDMWTSNVIMENKKCKNRSEITRKADYNDFE